MLLLSVPPLIRTLALIGGLQAAAIAVTVVRAKLISVSLGPEGLGIIGTIDQFLAVVLQLSSLSLPAVAIRLLPRSHGAEPDVFRRQYANFVRVVALASSVGAASAAAVVWTSPALLGAELAEYRVEVAIALASVPLLALGLLLPNVMAAAQRHAGAALLYFAVAAVTAAAAGIGVRIGSIREIYVLQLALLAGCLGLTLVYLRARLGLTLAGRGGVIKQLVKDNPDLVTTAAVAYVAFVGTAVALFVVRSVTLSAAGAEQAGLLQGLLSMVLSVGAVLSAMAGRYLGPLLNRRVAPVDKRVVAELFRRRQLILLTVIALPLALFAEPALALLFSGRFVPAGAWLPAFLVWQLITLQFGIQQQLLLALDDLHPIAVIAAAGTLLAVVACGLLVPRFGLTGAAAAMLGSALLMHALGAHRLKHRHQIAPERGSRLLTTYVAFVLLVPPVLLGPFAATPANAALRLSICGVLLGSLAMFLDDAERAQLKAYVRTSVARW